MATETRVSSGRGLTDHLLRRRDSLDHLEPGVHAQCEHSFLDRRVADLGSADVLHDELSDAWRHHHDFVHALTSLETSSLAFVAAGALEERDFSNRRIEAELLE